MTRASTRSSQDPDPQLLLPLDAREGWAVVPRDTLYQCVLVGALLGAGLALTITGFALDLPRLRVAFGVALLLAWLQNRVLPWSEPRLLARLKRRG